MLPAFESETIQMENNQSLQNAYQFKWLITSIVSLIFVNGRQ